MKKGSSSTRESYVSGNVHLLGVSPFRRLREGKQIESEKLSEALARIQNKLNEGFSAEAAEICFGILEEYSNSIDVQAKLNQQISSAFEMEGRFEDALEVLKPFEAPEVIEELKPESLANIYTQQAVAYANLNDPERAVDLLNRALKIAQERDFTYLLTSIKLVFARIYREQNEYPVSRNYAEKAVRSARETGDWRGVAESYRIIATSYHQEGNSQKAIELLQQALKIIGDRPAPFLLGRIHSDLSAAYSAVPRPEDGIDSLKKAIVLFEKIQQKFHLAIAYNNLGANLLLSGNWKKAEEVLNKAVDLALEINHAHLAAIVCSVGELNLVRGDLTEAEKLFTQALALAEEKKREWYIIQISYNLARCFLAQNRTSDAIKKAEETIKRSRQISENHYKILTQLVLAESYFRQKKARETEEILYEIEENEGSTDFFVQGSVARLRGLIETEKKDETLAIHQFSRSLSIFELAGDVYHMAFANFELGKAEAFRHPDKAQNHLRAAVEVFEKLALPDKVKLAESALADLERKAAVKVEERSTNSHLLMLRLVEAISSRELLFRELITIVRQEGKAKKTILAETKEGKKFTPSIIDGFIPSESNELIAKVHEAQLKNNLDTFAREKNLSIFHLRAPNAQPAILIIAPLSGATLADGSSINPLLRVVELGMEVCALREHTPDGPNPLITDSSPLTTQGLMPGFIHSSPAMMELVNEIQKIRTSDVTTLITGESGTGKELIAKAIHLVSKRKDKVFVPFNCTAVPKELTEGHLFGYKKGSFTGAVADSVGVIRAADGGTLFLDEIGDLPLDVQPKILRFLQEGEVQPLGEKSPKQVDVRIIAATNMNLEEKVAQGLFREDLYYRLNVIRLRVPPLRERRSEIPQLINYYINHYSAKFGRQDLTMSSEAMDLLIAYNWQGNVRQLCNEVQRIVARSDNGDRISPLHLSPEIKPSEDFNERTLTGNVRANGFGSAISIQTQGGTLEEAVTALEIQLISDSLGRHNNNISRVARELGLTRRGLYMKLDRYKIRPGGN
jgi:hydrogenase-4 transcriptional activator